VAHGVQNPASSAASGEAVADKCDRRGVFCVSNWTGATVTV